MMSYLVNFDSVVSHHNIFILNILHTELFVHVVKCCGSSKGFSDFLPISHRRKIGSVDSRQVARTFDAIARMREPPAPQVARSNLPWA